jgi:hypothetical protein
MLQPFYTLGPESPSKLKRKPSIEYTELIRTSPTATQHNAGPGTPDPPVQAHRRLSLLVQHRNAADALTHPSRNFHLPCLATRNVAHAEELLAVFCGRLVDWGLATFEETSPEACLLRELSTLNLLLQSSAQTRAADPTAFETEAHASAVLSLTREAMTAKDHVTSFRLNFEVDKHLYDIVEVVQCLHGCAVSTLLGLFLST